MYISIIIIIVCVTADDVFSVVWVSRTQEKEGEEEVIIVEAGFNPEANRHTSTHADRKVAVVHRHLN